MIGRAVCITSGLVHLPWLVHARRVEFTRTCCITVTSPRFWIKLIAIRGPAFAIEAAHPIVAIVRCDGIPTCVSSGPVWVLRQRVSLRNLRPRSAPACRATVFRCCERTALLKAPVAPAAVLSDGSVGAHVFEIGHSSLHQFGVISGGGRNYRFGEVHLLPVTATRTTATLILNLDPFQASAAKESPRGDQGARRFDEQSRVLLAGRHTRAKGAAGTGCLARLLAARVGIVYREVYCVAGLAPSTAGRRSARLAVRRIRKALLPQRATRVEVFIQQLVGVRLPEAGAEAHGMKDFMDYDVDSRLPAREHARVSLGFDAYMPCYRSTVLIDLTPRSVCVPPRRR